MHACPRLPHAQVFHSEVAFQGMKRKLQQLEARDTREGTTQRTSSSGMKKVRDVA
jgi:hypothetical protein